MRGTDPVWDDLVSTALVGTSRRTAADPPGGALGEVAARLDRGDEAVRLLDLAALVMVHRRAGRGACPGTGAPVDVAEPDDRPAVPEAARVRLRLLLEGGEGDFLPEWLALARAGGHRAPESELPALLTAARSRADLREDVAVLAGPRGRWLAARNPDWSWLTRHAPVPVPVPASGQGAGADPGDVWRHGLFGERLAVLRALRADDPAAGRALVEAGRRGEPAEDRALLLGALRTGLSAADEPFLETALDDRAKAVRAAAARLLCELPGSAYAARMAARARACLRPDGDGGIVVVPPAAYDEAMRRDGIAERSPTGREDRAWWLGEVVAATPLFLWPELLGGPAADIAGRRLPRRWADDVRDGWARAAIAQHDVVWARALVGRDTPTRLLTVLPPAERAVHVARHVAAHGLSEALQALTHCPAPWPAALGTAVLDALAGAARDGTYPWSFSGARDVAGRCLDPDAAERADALATEAAGAWGSDDGGHRAREWAGAFRTLAGTLRTRGLMRAELRG